MLQVALHDVDWDMSWVSSFDVSGFTDVAISYVNILTEQATETVTIRTFLNQKPWVDRSIRDAVNQCTATYNAGLLSGNMSEYNASCYALRRAVRAAKLRYRERIESQFQLNDSRPMWQRLRTIYSFGNKSSTEVRADALLAGELNTFYGRFECNGSSVTLPISNLMGLLAVFWGPALISLLVCLLQYLMSPLLPLWFPPALKKSIIIPVPNNSKPSCLNDYRPVALPTIVMKVFERLVKNHICSSIPVTLDPPVCL